MGCGRKPRRTFPWDVSRPVMQECERLGLRQGEVAEEDMVPETQLRAQNRKRQLQIWPQG